MTDFVTCRIKESLVVNDKNVNENEEEEKNNMKKHYSGWVLMRLIFPWHFYVKFTYGQVGMSKSDQFISNNR